MPTLLSYGYTSQYPQSSLDPCTCHRKTHPQTVAWSRRRKKGKGEDVKKIRRIFPPPKQPLACLNLYTSGRQPLRKKNDNGEDREGDLEEEWGGRASSWQGQLPCRIFSAFHNISDMLGAEGLTYKETWIFSISLSLQQLIVLLIYSKRKDLSSNKISFL